jgi:hypothetical protein
MLEIIHRSLNELHKKVDEGKRAQDETEKELILISAEAEDNTSNCSNLKSDNEKLRSDVDILKSIVTKQSEDIRSLTSQMLELQSRSMRDNVIFHNISEEPNENCMKKVVQKLKDMNFEGDVSAQWFERIHRLGKPNPNPKYPRPIVAKLSTQRDAQRLLSFGSGLSKDKASFRVTPQYPTALRERRRQLAEKAESAKAKAPNVKTKIIQDDLFVNGQKIYDQLSRPCPRDLFQMSPSERNEAEAVKFITTNPILEGGSSFIARAAEVRSINDVRAVYKALMLKPGALSATHNVVAYRLYNPLGAKVEDGYFDDMEHGFGRVMKNALQNLNAQNVAVFITRQYGQTHLGAKRFEVYSQLVRDVIRMADSVK